MRNEGTRGDEGDVTFFSEESNKEPVCDEKVDLIKLGVALATRPTRHTRPRGREKLESLGLE